MNHDLQKTANIMVVMGVLAWLPFLYLVAIGQEPSIYPFLALHLSGVLGGSRLRAYARPLKTEKRPRRQILGRTLIILGVLAWAPYLYQKEVLGLEIEMAPFLAAHLTGVLGGIALLLSLLVERAWRRTRQKSLSEEGLP